MDKSWDMNSAVGAESVLLTTTAQRRREKSYDAQFSPTWTNTMATITQSSHVVSVQELSTISGLSTPRAGTNERRRDDCLVFDLTAAYYPR